MEQVKPNSRRLPIAKTHTARPMADALMIVTDWEQFRARENIYRPEEMRALGFRYESIGRP